MREIKFRAWKAPMEYPHIKEMHYFGIDSFDSDDGSLWINTDVGILYYYEMLECALMQYTGLKDKNGKECFEGDLVKYTFPGTGEEQVDEVRFVLGCFTPDIWRTQEFEIVGNIYEKVLEKLK